MSIRCPLRIVSMPSPPLDYLAGCSKAFCNLADLVLLVNGTECRVHGQVVAKECKVSIVDLETICCTCTLHLAQFVFPSLGRR